MNHILQKFLADSAAHGCLKNSRSNCHNSDLEFSQVSCHWQSHSNECSLRGRVNHLTFLTLKASNACNINDNSSFSFNLFLFGHNLSSMFRYVESTNHVNFKHSFHDFRRNDSFRENGCSCCDDTCTIYHNVDFLVVLNCEFYQLFDVFLIGYVGFEK